MKQAKLALLLSSVLLLAVAASTLAGAPLRVVRTEAKIKALLGSTIGTASVCQAGETLPGGVTSIRVGLAASFGPRVTMRVYSHSRVLIAGSRDAGWTGTTVTVPVTELGHTVSDVTLCFSVPENDERLELYGVVTGARKAAVGGSGERLPGRVSVEYMAPGGASWWSRALSVARHVGVGHAISGTWVALLLAALMAAVAALVIGLGWRELP